MKANITQGTLRMLYPHAASLISGHDDHQYFYPDVHILKNNVLFNISGFTFTFSDLRAIYNDEDLIPIERLLLKKYFDFGSNQYWSTGEPTEDDWGHFQNTVYKYFTKGSQLQFAAGMML